jgi:hypothetical protein
VVVGLLLPPVPPPLVVAAELELLLPPLPIVLDEPELPAVPPGVDVSSPPHASATANGIAARIKVQ